MAGQVLIKFPLYLAELKMMEKAKPKSQRRKVPSAREIASESGLPHTTVSRIVYGHVKSLNLEKAAKIIDVMRARGFDTRMTDMIDYLPNRVTSDGEDL
ncbi:MAG: hypothetical protein ACPGWR_28205 [Ardenticatenaceae bacterium]